MSEREAAGLAYGRLNEIEQVLQHVHLRRVPVSTPAGEIDVIAPGAISDRTTMPVFQPVPACGAHSDALREEFGRVFRRPALR